MLTATIITPKQSYKSQQLVNVKVILTNTGPKDLKMLKRDTPLDSVLSDCLKVTVGGKAIEYDGPMVKRAAPTANDYIEIKAGQSVEAEFPISSVYDTSKAGQYKVELKSPLPDVRPKSASVAKALKANALKPATPVVKPVAAFKVETGPKKRLTLGEIARTKEFKTKTAPLSKVKPLSKMAKTTKKSANVKKKGAAAAASAPLPPDIEYGTTAKKAAAKTAHADGYQLCVSALTTFANDAWYKKWFGTHTTSRFQKAKSTLQTVKSLMETLTFTYNLSGNGCEPSVFAYTYKGTTTIWFCGAFWSAPATGTDSKAGTVLHEHTHSDANTDDHVYGQASCKQLAIDDPDSAVENADTFEYFGKG